MNRRNFLKNSSVAILAIPALTTLNNKQADAFKGDDNNLPDPLANDDFILNEITIDQLQEKMSQGKLTSAAITQMYLDRINAIDKNGHKINSVIELNPDAKSIALEMDNERKSGKVRGPMHGIPVLIKDNINTNDKMITSAGSLSIATNHASADAFIIRQLRKAGAVILGKTNLSEWANFRSTRSTSGWSSRGGQTRNPFILDRSPCGSSSGSAAAVASNLCAVAIGTETDGSVTAPSSCCGVVGLKPTVGLLSRSGIIPISITQDTAGPIARTVKDAAILLSALTGIDNDDLITKESNGKIEKDFSASLDKAGLAGKIIGVEKSHLEGHEEVITLFKTAIDVLKKAGATIIEIDLLKKTNELNDAEFTILKYEFKDGLNKYLAAGNTNIKSLADVIAFNNANKNKAMPFFKQELLEDCNGKEGLDSKEYKDALEKSLSSRKIIDTIMQEKNLDAITGVTFGPPCCIDLINGDYNTGFYFCSPAAMAGYPHITIPMGLVNEVPVGLSFITGAYQEHKLLKMAFTYEESSKKRRQPKFIKSSIPD